MHLQKDVIHLYQNSKMSSPIEKEKKLEKTDD